MIIALFHLVDVAQLWFLKLVADHLKLLGCAIEAGQSLSLSHAVAE